MSDDTQCAAAPCGWGAVTRLVLTLGDGARITLGLCHAHALDIRELVPERLAGTPAGGDTDACD